jgi:hypothetical protein
MVLGLGYDSDLILEIDEAQGHILRTSLVQMNLDVRIGFAETGDDPGHEIAGIGLGGSESEDPSLEFPHIFDHIFHFLFIFKDLAHIGIEYLSLVAQVYLSAPFLEEFQVAGGFKLPYLGGDGRLGNKKLLSSGREIFMFCGQGENPELVKIERETLPPFWMGS